MRMTFFFRNCVFANCMRHSFRAYGLGLEAVKNLF